MALLVSAADVRAAGIPSITGTSQDSALIEPLIERAQDLIASHLGYPAPSSGAVTLESASYVLYLTGRATGQVKRLILPFDQNRITALSSIYEDAGHDFAAGSLVASGDYSLNAGEGWVLRPAQGWNTAEGSIKVTLTAGWTSGTVPAGVASAIIQTVAHLLRLKGEQGRASVSVSGVSVSAREEDLPASVVQAVAGYKLPPWEV